MISFIINLNKKLKNKNIKFFFFFAILTGAINAGNGTVVTDIVGIYVVV